jgi:hypothetical protein
MTCPVSRILACIEQRYRTRLNCEPRIPLQIVFGQIALEVQKERFKHESKCVRCRSNESAAQTYRSNRARTGGRRWIA